MSQTSANVIAGDDARASDINKIIADLAEIYAGGPGVPIGGIIHHWSDNTVPLNYKVMDGTVISSTGSPVNGLTIPNAIDRFIRGVAISNLRVTPVSGGADTHTLSVDEMPSHAHSASTDVQGYHLHNGPFATNQIVKRIENAGDGLHGFSDGATNRQTDVQGGHGHNVFIGANGGNLPHNNIPAYRGFVPIMRIK